LFKASPFHNMKRLKSRLKNLPLASKLTGFASLLIMFAVIALTYLNIQREQSTFQQELVNQASLLLETLPLTMRDQLYQLELDELADIAGVVSDNDNVTLFVIYDSRGIVLVDASRSQLAFSQEVDPLGQTLLGFGRSQNYLDWQEDQLVAGHAVLLGNQPIGAVAIGLSTELLAQKISALTSQSIGLALVTLILGAVLAFLFARQITNPLNELSDVASQMTGGDLSARVTLDSKDEIGQLGDAFNQMVSSIQRRETELRELAAGLERSVADRTSELRKQNQTLVIINEELRIARRQAEAANHTKNLFLASMSHELRTPLNAILGFSQIMQRNPALTVEQKENLAIINRNGEHLLELINDILEISKIEAGQIALSENEFDLSRLLTDLENTFHLSALNKGLHLKFEFDQDLPQYIRTDERKLRQILTNLINNAIKFTESGDIVIKVIRGEQGDKKNKIVSSEPSKATAHLRFEVKDTGPGIDSEELEIIFEAFSQAESGRRSQVGTGLGLAISWQFVRMMGGELEVESNLGEGTLFWFEIDVVMVSAEEVPSLHPIHRVIGLEPDQPDYRILIVGDKVDNRKLLAQLLEPIGFELQEAGNGREAIDIWEEWRPDLIWMEMRMPVMDGIEASEHIKGRPDGQSTIIIALTAGTIEEDQAAVLASGCDDILRKPFREEEVFKMMSKHLRVRFHYEESSPSSPPMVIQERFSPLTTADLAELDRELLAELRQAVEEINLEKTSALIDRIRQDNEGLGRALTDLAENYRFDKLQTLVTSRLEDMITQAD